MNKSAISSFKSTAFILAGGKSSRMGTDKGLIDLNGKQMIRHVIDCLSPIFNDIIIISNNPLYTQFGSPVFEDRIKNIGPLGGILTALQLSDTSWNFIIACDLPFMNASVIKLLIQKEFNCQAIVPVLNNQIEPLCAFYHKSCIPILESQIAASNYKVHDSLDKMQVHKISVPEFGISEINPFNNINSIADIQKSIQA